MTPDVTTKSNARFIAHFLSLSPPVPPPDQLETISRGEWSSMGTATYPKQLDPGQRPIQIDDQI